MADTPSQPTTSQETPPAAGNQFVFQILRIYIKDCSIELPHAPDIFLEREAPQAEVQLDLGDKKIADDTYEVWVTSTVTTKLQDKVVMLVEVKQAGIFQLKNFSDEQLRQVLQVNCPTILFPYLRAQVADLISRASFPVLHLNDINFEVIYRQRLNAAAANAPATPQA